MTSTEPACESVTFAVVGRVNKGKSSIIATLAEDDRVAVSPLPGTTRDVSAFPVTVDGRTLFTLVDTPGFEQAPEVLAWLERETVRSDQRAARVRAFVAYAETQDAFSEEQKLLAPILAGAAILYVVDGDKPYRDNYRAEMEILRWTGQPSVALINRVGGGEHVGDWHRALNQYFKVVREFDAQKATFIERIGLLTTLRELHEPFRAPLQRAIDALYAEDERRRRESANVICELLIASLTFFIQTRGESSVDPRKLEQDFHDHLRGLEHSARDQLARLYHHDRVSWQSAQELARPVFGEDLFAERTFSSLGLSARELLAGYALSGAVTGGLIDASVGAASFGAGAALGALFGAGATAIHLKRRFESATRVGGALDRFRNALASGPSYRIGPMSHPNFPFVVLDRALRYHDAVQNRAHALSAAGQDLSLKGAGLSDRLSAQSRKTLAGIFSRLRRQPDFVPPDVQGKLLRELRSLLARDRHDSPPTEPLAGGA